jgi:hypothetical protein
MRRLAADVTDQTRKTPAQSRTRFVGHRQLPWIQLERSCTLFCHSEARNARTRNLDADVADPISGFRINSRAANCPE